MITSFITIGVVLLVYVSAGFVMSIVWTRNDVADVMWGPGVFIAALTALLASGDTVSTAPLAYLICGFTFLWAADGLVTPPDFVSMVGALLPIALCGRSSV